MTSYVFTKQDYLVLAKEQNFTNLILSVLLIYNHAFGLH
jgi:uncharacterized membrane protein